MAQIGEASPQAQLRVVERQRDLVLALVGFPFAVHVVDEAHQLPAGDAPFRGGAVVVRSEVRIAVTADVRRNDNASHRLFDLHRPVRFELSRAERGATGNHHAARGAHGRVRVERLAITPSRRRILRRGRCRTESTERMDEERVAAVG